MKRQRQESLNEGFDLAITSALRYFWLVGGGGVLASYWDGREGGRRVYSAAATLSLPVLPRPSPPSPCRAAIRRKGGGKGGNQVGKLWMWCQFSHSISCFISRDSWWVANLNIVKPSSVSEIGLAGDQMVKKNVTPK